MNNVVLDRQHLIFDFIIQFRVKLLLFIGVLVWGDAGGWGGDAGGEGTRLPTRGYTLFYKLHHHFN